MQIDEIEHKIAINELSAAQVFTQMKQHIQSLTISRNAALSREREANREWSKAAMKWHKEKKELTDNALL